MAALYCLKYVIWWMMTWQNLKILQGKQNLSCFNKLPKINNRKNTQKNDKNMDQAQSNLFSTTKLMWWHIIIQSILSWMSLVGILKSKNHFSVLPFVYILTHFILLANYWMNIEGTKTFEKNTNLAQIYSLKGEHRSDMYYYFTISYYDDVIMILWDFCFWQRLEASCFYCFLIVIC